MKAVPFRFVNKFIAFLTNDLAFDAVKNDPLKAKYRLQKSLGPTFLLDENFLLSSIIDRTEAIVGV
jgi:hypothetical protein